MIARPGPLRSVVSDRSLVAEATPQDGSLDDLYPCELAAVELAVLARQREYAAGRALARILLAQLGRPGVALPPTQIGCPSGRPVAWAASHCNTHVAVAVAEDFRLRSIGCDVEPALALPREVVDRVLSRAERAALVGAESWSERLVFCAKEAAYKAQFPLTRQLLDFHDVEIEMDLSGGAFQATVLPPVMLPGIEPILVGRFTVSHGLIATAVEVPA